MPTYNYKSRELIAKIVYYGPGRCGKTTNLQQIHARMRPETRSELLSVATETDRTIYFDLLPLNLGTISGMKFMVRLFTVPGQVYYSETRKLVLKGADGIVFVADSQDHMVDENRQSLHDLKTNLAANGLDYNNIPLVLQWNKRDLPHLIPEAELDSTLNDRGLKAINAVASQGTGVLETLRHITLGVFNHIKAGGQVGPTPRARGGQTVPPPPPPPDMAAPSAPPAPSANASGRFDAPPSSRPAVGTVTPGSWSASIPKTSLSDGQSPASAARQPAAPPPAPREGPSGMAISADMVVEEFKHLAVVQ
ncbi:MAG: GTPase domain-containing protein, partial [Myxococcota bacterium]